MSARCPSGWGGAWGAPGARLSTAHATLAVHAPARCSRAVTFTYTPILVLRRLLDSHLGLCSLRGWRPLGPRAGSGRRRTGLRLATSPACGRPASASPGVAPPGRVGGRSRAAVAPSVGASAGAAVCGDRLVPPARGVGCTVGLTRLWCGLLDGCGIRPLTSGCCGPGNVSCQHSRRRRARCGPEHQHRVLRRRDESAGVRGAGARRWVSRGRVVWTGRSGPGARAGRPVRPWPEHCAASLRAGRVLAVPGSVFAPCGGGGTSCRLRQPGRGSGLLSPKAACGLLILKHPLASSR